jgi:hypothetical protein
LEGSGRGLVDVLYSNFLEGLEKTAINPWIGGGRVEYFSVRGQHYRYGSLFGLNINKMI